MSHIVRAAVLSAALSLAPGLVRAQCPPDCPLKGGGAAETDCQAEFASPVLRLNYPPFDPAAPQPGTEVRCFDGDAGCDTDGAVDRACVFDVDVCLRNQDPSLPACTAADVTSVTVVDASGDPDLEALQSALDELLPATSNVCTSGRTLRVPLDGPDASGAYHRGHKTVHLEAQTSDGGTDVDELELSCVPRGWPTHGYDQANHRNNPLEDQISPDNAAQLRVKWNLDLHALEGAGANGVTSTPTVGNGMLYVSSWHGYVYALNPADASVIWKYDTGSGIVLGVQSTPTLTADGRLLVGDSTAVVHCLDAITGKLLWKKSIGNFTVDHIWASPTIANGRVFIGVASHSDNPCTNGRLVAMDLDTGDVLWTHQTVPDRVCNNDTAVECTVDADCGGGTCVAGIGAGVTATVAVDPSGETVYMNTVGCYRFPSIGDSDSIFRLDAATGATVWKNRVQPPEQFGACTENPAIDCGSDAECAGTCQTKANYHDFGFLNGPILVDADDGAGGRRPLVVSGSKDGTLYALDPDDGSIVWKNVVVPTPVTPGFAGFGLFNGAVGFADQKFYAGLYRMILIPPVSPLPPHLMAFSAVDGGSVWEDEIGDSWGSVALANGVLYVGTEVFVNVCENDTSVECSAQVPCPGGASCVMRSPYYVYDASNGRRLNTFLMPTDVSGGASIADGVVYVPYGVFGGNGGVMALALGGVCGGDCNGDGTVTIDELIRGVNIALGLSSVDACPSFDQNADGQVTIDELVAAVDHALNGC